MRPTPLSRRFHRLMRAGHRPVARRPDAELLTIAVATPLKAIQAAGTHGEVDAQAVLRMVLDVSAVLVEAREDLHFRIDRSAGVVDVEPNDGAPPSWSTNTDARAHRPARVSASRLAHHPGFARG